MTNPLDALRAKARRDVALDSGDSVTVRRISMVDVVILGDDVPMPVIDQLAAEDEADAERPEDAASARLAVETMRTNRRKQDDIIRTAVVAVNAKPCEIKPDEDLSELFTDADRVRISNAALWLDAEGKA